MQGICKVLEGEAPKVAFRGCAEETAHAPESVIFPGSFAPWHDGHRQIAEFAAEQTGGSVGYEISVTNVEKRALSPDDVIHRLRGFPSLERVWLTRAPTFVEKAEVFPGATFVVGVDTMQRIADERFYVDTETDVAGAVECFRELETRYLVFGRVVGGVFRVLSDLKLPEGLLPLCAEIPEARFRFDISSSEIRRTV